MDIVERLRIRADLKSPNDFVKQRRIETEAADEIERLRKDYALAWENHLLHEQIFVLTAAKIERLKETLKKIVDLKPEYTWDVKDKHDVMIGFMTLELAITIAEDALKEGE